MCDAFRDAVDYQFMCGGQWVAHPGNIIDYRVDIKPRRSGHGRHRRFRLPLRAVLHARRPVERGAGDDDLLRRARAVDQGRRHAGRLEAPPRQGPRLLFSSLGHVAKEFEVPEMRTILKRGLLWAARLKPRRRKNGYSAEILVIEGSAKAGRIAIAMLDSSFARLRTVIESPDDAGFPGRKAN
jgi:hypothetical protein